MSPREIKPKSFIAVPLEGICIESNQPLDNAGDTYNLDKSNYICAVPTSEFSPDMAKTKKSQSRAGLIYSPPGGNEVVTDPVSGQVIPYKVDGKTRNWEGLTNYISHTYSAVKDAVEKGQKEGRYKTPFYKNPEKERQSIVQQACWYILSRLTDDPYEKKDFRANMVKQLKEKKGVAMDDMPKDAVKKFDEGVDSFWSSFELASADAKCIETKVAEAEKKEVTWTDIKDSFNNRTFKPAEEAEEAPPDFQDETAKPPIPTYAVPKPSCRCELQTEWLPYSMPVVMYKISRENPLEMVIDRKFRPRIDIALQGYDIDILVMNSYTIHSDGRREGPNIKTASARFPVQVSWRLVRRQSDRLAFTDGLCPHLLYRWSGDIVSVVADPDHSSADWLVASIDDPQSEADDEPTVYYIWIEFDKNTKRFRIGRSFYDSHRTLPVPEEVSNRGICSARVSHSLELVRRPHTPFTMRAIDSPCPQRDWMCGEPVIARVQPEDIDNTEIICSGGDCKPDSKTISYHDDYLITWRPYSEYIWGSGKAAVINGFDWDISTRACVREHGVVDGDRELCARVISEGAALNRKDCKKCFDKFLQSNGDLVLYRSPDGRNEVRISRSGTGSIVRLRVNGRTQTFRTVTNLTESLRNYGRNRIVSELEITSESGPGISSQGFRSILIDCACGQLFVNIRIGNLSIILWFDETDCALKSYLFSDISSGYRSSWVRP